MSPAANPIPPKSGLLNGLKEFPKNIWNSIFRNPVPSNDLEKSATSFTNFFLHIHPVKVHKHSLKPTYTLGLGLISFFLFVILILTGILLMFYYVPSTTQAYDRMLDLRGTVAFGMILRNMHRWSAHGMVAVVFLHMARVFFTGAYKKPREFNWVMGVALFLLTLFLSFTGYLLPWDQLAFWAITVGTAIAGYAPVVGKDIQFLLMGGTSVGQEALLRFYVLHVAVLPAILTLGIALHFWRIRKDGGLSRPPEADATPALEFTGPGTTVKSAGPEPRKTYGLQGLVRGPITKAGQVPDNTVFSWPDLFRAELFTFVITLSAVLILSLLFNAPLEEPVTSCIRLTPPSALVLPGAQEMVATRPSGAASASRASSSSCPSSRPTSLAGKPAPASGSPKSGCWPTPSSSLPCSRISCS